jgi:hypothetical protein
VREKIIKVFLFIDLLVLIAVFQKFSSWSQKTFGLTNFWWAKFFAKAVFILWTVDYIMGFFEGNSQVFLVFASLFEIYMAVFMYNVIKLSERLEEKYAKGHKHMNERIYLWAFMRIQVLLLCSWVSLTSLSLIFVGSNPWTATIVSVGFILIPGVMFFLSCTPISPTDSKVKMWLKNMKKKVAEILSPDMEPEPSSC